MSIQPLVENSVKHGFHGDGRKLVINLKAVTKEGGLIIEIEDNSTNKSSY